MKEKIIILIMGLVAQIIGTTILWYYHGWYTALAVWLLIGGNNIITSLVKK